MPELRWTLLILGALFVAVLAWWELRKPRQARRGDVDLRSNSSSSLTNRESEHETSTRVYREPTMSLPDVRPRTIATGELPVIEVKDDSMLGLRIDGQTIEESERELPPLEDKAVLPSEREPTSNRESLASNEIDWRIEADEPHVTWAEENEEADERKVSKPVVARDKPGDESTRVPDIGVEFEGEAPGEIVVEPEAIPAPPPPAPPTPREALASKLAPVETSESAQPKVEWPDDAERTILSLRLVATNDRFSGRALRQALMGEGFALGKMDIFHKAGPDGRAIISAASLTRPGTFNIDTIDTQRYTGLNLFAVLPGPLSGAETFEELITTVRSMNERLRGGLQDDMGQPLTPTRISALRSTVIDTAPLAPMSTPLPDATHDAAASPDEAPSSHIIHDPNDEAISPEHAPPP